MFMPYSVGAFKVAFLIKNPVGRLAVLVKVEDDHTDRCARICRIPDIPQYRSEDSRSIVNNTHDGVFSGGRHLHVVDKRIRTVIVAECLGGIHRSLPAQGSLLAVSHSGHIARGNELLLEGEHRQLNIAVERSHLTGCRLIVESVDINRVTTLAIDTLDREVAVAVGHS